MLAHSKEGKLSLEDGDGSVELDFTRMVCDDVCIMILPLTLQTRMNLERACLQKGASLWSKGSIQMTGLWK